MIFLSKVLNIVSSAGNNSSWFNGKVLIQCSVWLDCSAN